MPDYGSQFPDPTITPPPEGAIYDTFGRPTNQDALDYEISMIEKTIEDLQKEIIKLKSVKESPD
jgi:cell division protein FtsI/penicillin-binding protein 2